MEPNPLGGECCGMVFFAIAVFIVFKLFGIA